MQSRGFESFVDALPHHILEGDLRPEKVDRPLRESPLVMLVYYLIGCRVREDGGMA